jgi:fatty-acid desaturase
VNPQPVFVLAALGLLSTALCGRAWLSALAGWVTLLIVACSWLAYHRQHHHH